MEMAAMVPSVCLWEHEFPHHLCGGQRFGRICQPGASVCGRSHQDVLRRACRPRLRAIDDFGDRIAAGVLARPLPVSAKNFPAAVRQDAASLRATAKKQRQTQADRCAFLDRFATYDRAAGKLVTY